MHRTQLQNITKQAWAELGQAQELQLVFHKECIHERLSSIKGHKSSKVVIH